jgi:putative ABC transport system ATP-binding protein
VDGVNGRGLDLEVAGRSLLDGLDVEVRPASSLAVMGPSGSGKTSLLNALAGIVEVQGERLDVAGGDLLRLGAGARARHRLQRLGLVFQQAELMPELSLLENVTLPLRLLGRSKASSAEVAEGWIDRVGLGGLADRRPATLSGGEAQRVAVARALAHGPSVVLADEPTGSLDTENAGSITDLLLSLAVEGGASVVLVTHDSSVARRADQVRLLRDGRLHEWSAMPAGVA